MQAQILELLRDIQAKTGTSIIFITHDLGVVANVADRVAVMADGKLLLTGTPREVFAETELLRAHRLDVPAMTELKERLNAHGAGLTDDILTVEDMTDAICRLLLKN